MDTRRATSRGLTLVELLVTLAIFAIVAGFAVGIYDDYVTTSRRADAHVGLLRLSSEQMKFFANQGRYTANVASLGYPATSPRGFYVVSVSTTLNGFTLIATPPSGGVQANDSDCPRIGVTHTGRQFMETSPGTEGTNDQADECWGR